MNWLMLLALLFSMAQDPQMPAIGIIDFYGLRNLSERQVRDALQIKEGDPTPLETKETQRRLESLPGVAEARVSRVCCDAGKAILFIGIREKGAPALQFRPAPQGKVRLPPDVAQAGTDYLTALSAAVLSGNSSNDNSQGHALSSDPAMRAIEERYLTFAARDLKLLRAVLRQAADAEQRALAAEVIAYTANKQAIVNDLVEATRDPAEGVRNNATRALVVMALSNQQTTRQPIKIPLRPFVEMLNSVEWTDRNKASFALSALTDKPDPGILAELRQQALPALIEMARWKSSGHAGASFSMLGRVAGFPEAEITAAWERGDHAAFVERATERIKAK